MSPRTTTLGTREQAHKQECSFVCVSFFVANWRQSLPASDTDGHRQSDEDQTGPRTEDLQRHPDVQELPGSYWGRPCPRPGQGIASSQDFRRHQAPWQDARFLMLMSLLLSRFHQGILKYPWDVCAEDPDAWPQACGCRLGHKLKFRKGTLGQDHPLSCAAANRPKKPQSHPILPLQRKKITPPPICKHTALSWANGGDVSSETLRSIFTHTTPEMAHLPSGGHGFKRTRPGALKRETETSWEIFTSFTQESVNL